MFTSKVLQNAETGENFTFSKTRLTDFSAEIGETLLGEFAQVENIGHSLLRHGDQYVATGYRTCSYEVVAVGSIRHWENGKWVEYRQLIVQSID